MSEQFIADLISSGLFVCWLLLILCVPAALIESADKRGWISKMRGNNDE